MSDVASLQAPKSQCDQCTPTPLKSQKPPSHLLWISECHRNSTKARRACSRASHSRPVGSDDSRADPLAGSRAAGSARPAAASRRPSSTAAATSRATDSRRCPGSSSLCEAAPSLLWDGLRRGAASGGRPPSPASVACGAEPGCSGQSSPEARAKSRALPRSTPPAGGARSADDERSAEEAVTFPSSPPPPSSAAVVSAQPRA